MHASEVTQLASRGIIFPRGSTPMYVDDPRVAVAMDAQPQLSTNVPSFGVPWFFTNVADPEMIRVLVAPMKSVQIMGGEQKKGDWTTLTMQFPVGESTGETSSYGDYNNNGMTNFVPNWTPRQSYHFQTIIRWGEREAELYGAAAIDYSSELTRSSALVIAKFFNKVNFLGIAGLSLFGLLTDPSLPTPATPITKAAGGTAWVTTGGAPNATANEVFADVQTLFAQLVIQTKGLVDIDTASKMVLVMPPVTEVGLLTTNIYKVMAKDLITTAFPGIRIETAPEYATQAGNLMQLFIDEYDGIKTAVPAFTEKLRVHNTVPMMSAYQQKRSAGTWGTIIKRPILFAQLLGV